MSALVTETQDVLDQADWEALWKRLRRFAHKHYYWLSTKRGTDLDDLVQDAIVALLSGVRHLPRDVELETFLRRVIQSKANHIWMKPESRVVSIEQPQIYLRISSTPYIDCLEDAYKQAAYERHCERLREFVNDDEVLSRIVDTLLEKPDLKPRELAKELDIPTEEIHNAQKRLRRRARTLWEKWSNV